METRISAIDHVRSRRSSRAGYTLVEAMIASALLSVSVVGVGGAVATSYSHDQYAMSRQHAYASGTKLMDELSSLPLEAPTNDRVGLVDFATYSDSVIAEASASAIAAKQAAKQASAASGGGGQSGQGSGGSSGSGGLLGAIIDTATGLLNGLLGGGSGAGGSGGSGSSGTGSSGGETSTTSSTPKKTVQSTNAETTATTSRTIAARTVSVERRSTLAGGSVANGELAIVTVQVDIGDGKTIRMKRLVTSAEAASNTRTSD